MSFTTPAKPPPIEEKDQPLLIPRVAKSSQIKPCIIQCPAERHISVSFSEIYAIVKQSMSVSGRQNYEEVCQLMESLYAQQFMTLRRNLKQNFLAFSKGAKGQELNTRKGRGLPPKADLDVREEKLVADVLQLMAAARYSLVTRMEWDVAMSERFMFNLPVAVNWEYFDSKLLTTFWDSTPERRHLRSHLPHLADRVLVFHRGIGVAEDSGYYFSLKADLLVSYLLVNPLMRIWAWLCALFVRLFGRFLRIKPKAPPASTLTAEASRMLSGELAPADDGKQGDEGDEDSAPRHKAAKMVERRTLARLLPTPWMVIKNIHKSLDLQEPMYREVVVLYRTSGLARKGSKKKGPVRARSNAERLKDILSRRNVHMKCFHDIPMADMEVIFPDKKVYLKTVSLINMVVQGVGAFAGAIVGLSQAGKLDLQAVWSAMSLVAARVGQLYSSMQAERSEMVQDMVNILYDKTNDAQEGVISMLLEDMADQQLKEAVLAYTMLLLRIEDEVTMEELDDVCERFLEDNFELKLDFAVEDALPNLVAWGVVKHNKRNNRYQAESVEVAKAALSVAWARAYENLSKPPPKNALPLTALLPDGDRRAACGGTEFGDNLPPGVRAVTEGGGGSPSPAVKAAVEAAQPKKRGFFATLFKGERGDSSATSTIKVDHLQARVVKA